MEPHKEDEIIKAMQDQMEEKERYKNLLKPSSLFLFLITDIIFFYLLLTDQKLWKWTLSCTMIIFLINIVSKHYIVYWDLDKRYHVLISRFKSLFFTFLVILVFVDLIIFAFFVPNLYKIGRASCRERV